MDFGLARQLQEKEPGSPRRSTDPTPAPAVRPDAVAIAHAGEQATMVLNTVAGEASGPLDVPTHADMLEASLTRTGAMMGTPAYMAPEQFLGVGTDARTDQFSFCVALYEALYGQRPFGGNTLYALTNNVVQGRVREVPAHARVPAWLRKVVLRGLRSNPAERYPSMAELIETLGKNPTVQRRRVVAAAAVVMALVGLGIGVKRSAAEHTAMCSAGRTKLAEVWELEPNVEGHSPRQERIQSAFIKSGKSYAADVFATVSRTLTRYASSWADMYAEACEATQVRGEQSGEVLDLRMSCLHERLRGLRALTDLFTHPTGDAVENAVSAANALGSLERCKDVPLLRAVLRPPEDPAVKAQVGSLRDRLAALKALVDAGSYAEAMKNAPALVKEARALKYEPLLAETLALMGNVAARSNQPKKSEEALTEAYLVADSSSHDEVRAEAAETLIYVVGYQETRFEEAHRWARATDAVLHRLGGHELLRAWALNDHGAVYLAEGQKETALAALGQALSLKQKALGAEHPDVGVSEGNVAIVLANLNRYEEAKLHIDRALAIMQKGLGGRHPELAVHLGNDGEILNALGRFSDARRSFEMARAIWERELGPENRSLPDALTGIGVSFLLEGNPQRAVGVLEHAFKIRTALEANPSKKGETEFALAQALWDADRDRKRALRLAIEARQHFAKSEGPEKASKADAWIRLHVTAD